MNQVEEFNKERVALNKQVLETNNKVVKRVFSLDTITFQDGALAAKTKEMIGLTTSLVLRCDDCVKYHLGMCLEVGWSKEEIVDGMATSMVVGGTIMIPHLRRAISYLNDLED